MNEQVLIYLLFVLYTISAIVSILAGMLNMTKSIKYSLSDTILGIIVLVILVYIYST